LVKAEGVDMAKKCNICAKEVSWLISITSIHLCGECYFKYGKRLEDAISPSLYREIYKIKENRRIEIEN